MLSTYRGPRPFSCRPCFTGEVELADGVVLGTRDLDIEIAVTDRGVILRMSLKTWATKPD
jgi:hypothetical protein